MYFSKDWYTKNVAIIADEKLKREKTILFITSAADYLFEDCYQLVQELHKKAKESGDKSLFAFTLLYISSYQRKKGLTEEAAANFQEVERLLPEAPRHFTTAVVYQMVAFEYWGAGMRDKAFQLAYQGLKITEELGEEEVGWAGFQFGVFYFDMKDYDISLEYFLRSEKQARKFGLDYQLARTRSGAAGVYIATNKLEEGLKYNTLALEGYRECGHQTAISRALNDLGVTNLRLGKISDAEKYLREALQIREKLFYAPGIITSQIELSRVLMAREEKNEAEQFLKAGLALSEKTNSKQKASQCHMLLSELYKQKEQPWQALEHLENYFKVKSEVTGEETNNKIKSLQQKYATEKSDHEAEIHRLKNVELKKAYGEIEEKNKNILDSIHYAKRIQKALLASDTLLQKNLPEYFILYKPKDIVSGDFYWAYEGTNDLFFLAACDCTGHGVPGAFMSLINTNYLNDAVIEKGLTKPGEILNEVRKHLVAALNPEGSQEETRDGMDATLIAFNKKTNVLSFACANNPLLVIRNGELKTFTPDKFPVGIYPDYESKPFSNQQIELKKGDCVYLLTDGFGDQFGGPEGKKFKIKKLKELLLEIYTLPIQKQSEMLSKNHDNWKGELEQVDDVLVIGIRF